jgi:hypothetical protein
MAPIETADAPASLMNCRRLSVEFRKPELALFLCFDISIPFAHPEISARNHLTDERWRVNPFACFVFSIP